MMPDFCYAIQKTRGYSVIDTKKEGREKKEGEKSGEKNWTERARGGVLQSVQYSTWTQVKLLCEA